MGSWRGLGLLSVEGPLMVDVAEDATLQLRTDPVTGASTGISLFQQDLVGLRAIRYANWRTRRAGAVAYLDRVFW